MVEFWSNIFVDYFDGNSFLDTLLNPPKPISRFISPVDTIIDKPVDIIDIKLIGFLQGKKVYFTEGEIKEYIIE